jgi:ATP synthase protein I
MPEGPDPDRLKALTARIDRIKGKPAGVKTNTVKGFSQGEVAWRMIIELVTGMLLGMGIGYGLDAVFGTLPIFLVIFSLIGFAAGIKTMLGTAKQLAARNKADYPAADKDAGIPADDEED